MTNKNIFEWRNSFASQYHMLIPGSFAPFQIRISAISEGLISIPYERCMGKEPSCRFQQPQQSLCDSPPACSAPSDLALEA